MPEFVPNLNKKTFFKKKPNKNCLLPDKMRITIFHLLNIAMCVLIF